MCRTLRRLATWNSDRHTKSIIKLFLQVLLNHWRERHGILSLYQNHHRQLLLRKENEDKEREVERDAEEGKVVTDLSAMTIDPESKQGPTPTVGQDTQTNKVNNNSLSPHSCSPSTEHLNRDQEEQQQQQEEEDLKNRIQEPVENDFYDFLLLQSHFEDWDEEDNKDWDKQAQIVLSFLELAGLTEVTWERGGPLQAITSFDIKKMISALESNAFGMFDRSKKKPICFGRGKQKKATKNMSWSPAFLYDSGH